MKLIDGRNKCFILHSRLSIDKAESACDEINALLPQPITLQENVDYRKAFNDLGTEQAVAIKSACHGTVTMTSSKNNATWNIFPIDQQVNVVCEQKTHSYYCIEKSKRSRRDLNNLTFYNRLNDAYKEKVKKSKPGWSHVSNWWRNSNKKPTRKPIPTRLPTTSQSKIKLPTSHSNKPKAPTLNINPINAKPSWKPQTSKKPTNRLENTNFKLKPKPSPSTFKNLAYASTYFPTRQKIKRKFFVKPVKQCTLPNAVNGTLDGKFYCFADLGNGSYENAEAKCNAKNAKLPVPLNKRYLDDLITITKLLGIDQTTEIVLGVKYLPAQGFWADSNKFRIVQNNWWLNQPLPQNLANRKNLMHFGVHNFQHYYASFCLQRKKWKKEKGSDEGKIICQQELKDLTWRLRSNAVIVSDKPENYSHLTAWDRTFTCESGHVAYRLLLIDVVSGHLRMEYSYKDSYDVHLPKRSTISQEKFTKNELFDVSWDNIDVIKQHYRRFLKTNFSIEIPYTNDSVQYLSNFDNVNDFLFWRLLDTNFIRLIYKRKQAHFYEWDQLLGPITMSNYDKMQIQFQCLKYGQKCPIGYYGKIPNCLDVDECAEHYTNKCNHNARCINQDGGYLCQCKDGFYGNGLKCFGNF